MKSCGVLICSFRVNFAVFLDVKQVDASKNDIGPEGGKALADCLKINTTITQVR